MHPLDQKPTRPAGVKIGSSTRDEFGAKLREPCWRNRLQDSAIELPDTGHRIGEILGPEHPDTLDTMINLAATYLLAGRNADAIDLGKSSIERRRPEASAMNSPDSN
jgi:hypothetical protein